ncbi:MAG: WPE palindromic element domain-containing protein [Wolbachia sp.]
MPRHWDPGKLIVNEQTFSIKLPKSWIPVSGHWDDKKRALGSSGLKLQCLYSCDLYSIAE